MVLYDGYGNEVAVNDGAPTADVPIITKELPKLFITSDDAYTSVTKEENSKGRIVFIDGNERFNLPIKFKLQGSGSLNYDKKNLNITFYADDTYEDKQKIRFNNWYPTSKIHLKANEYDYAMCRNSVGARLAYELLGKNLPNGAEGYIDSFPCIMYYNGEYMGCHTVNLPQDGKTYNFDEDAETAGVNLCYRHDTYTNVWGNISHWEYRGDADETASMKAVFQAAHSVMVDSASLTPEIVETHFDKETLLGYLVFAQLGLCVDSLVNNWTLTTWDGIIWYHSYYDLDICFGIGGGQDGKNLSYDKDVFTSVQGGFNTFFAKVKELYANEMAVMYAKWRDSGLDAQYVYNKFHEFQMKWGRQNIEADRTVWAADKQGTSDISLEWITARIAWCDTYFGYTAE